MTFGSNLQRGVPASSTGEAEHRGLSITVKDLIWVKMILEPLGFTIEEPMIRVRKQHIYPSDNSLELYYI